MVKRLLAAPDPTDPEIVQRAVDPSLSSIRDLLTTRQSLGQHVEYEGEPYHVDTSVTNADGTTASFSGCVTDGGRLVDQNGLLVNGDVTTSALEGTLVLDGGAWKVQRYDVLHKVQGDVACGAVS
jgi:hypothetical protein